MDRRGRVGDRQWAGGTCLLNARSSSEEAKDIGNIIIKNGTPSFFLLLPPLRSSSAARLRPSAETVSLHVCGRHGL